MNGAEKISKHASVVRDFYKHISSRGSKVWHANDKKAVLWHFKVYIKSEVQSIRSLTVISVADIFQRVQNDMQTGKCKSFQQTPISLYNVYCVFMLIIKRLSKHDAV